jgi:hypothetical protein
VTPEDAPEYADKADNHGRVWLCTAHLADYWERQGQMRIGGLG